MPARDKTAMATTWLNLTENAALRGMLVEAEGVEEKDRWWFSVYDLSRMCVAKRALRLESMLNRYFRDSQKMALSIKMKCRHYGDTANSPVSVKETHPA